MRIASAASTGANRIKARVAPILSNSHFFTWSQSAIGLSVMSMNGTLPIGIGAWPESELVVVRRQPDIDGEHPKLLQKLEQPPLGGDR
jgi:hypothetical protein